MTDQEKAVRDREQARVVRLHARYIRNALLFKCSQLQKSIEAAKEALRGDDGTIIYESLRGSIEYCEQSYKEHKQALDELEYVGIK